jgi:hypothetical protein
VFTYAGPEPSVGYLLTDHDVVITVPSALGMASDSQALAFSFTARPTTSICQFARRAIDNLPGRQPVELKLSKGGTEKGAKPIIPPVNPSSDDEVAPEPTAEAALGPASRLGEVEPRAEDG